MRKLLPLSSTPLANQSMLLKLKLSLKNLKESKSMMYSFDNYSSFQKVKLKLDPLEEELHQQPREAKMTKRKMRRKKRKSLNQRRKKRKLLSQSPRNKTSTSICSVDDYLNKPYLIFFFKIIE